MNFIFIFEHFISLYRCGVLSYITILPEGFSFNISVTECLLVINSISFCLSEKVFISK